jgi:hypothetical protein
MYTKASFANPTGEGEGEVFGLNDKLQATQGHLIKPETK